MLYIKPDISPICIGQAASGGAVLLVAGAKGKRFCTPNSRVLIHQPHGGATGQAVDIDIQAREILRTRKLLDEIIAKHTGQSPSRLQDYSDCHPSPAKGPALGYGSIDEVIEK